MIDIEDPYSHMRMAGISVSWNLQSAGWRFRWHLRWRCRTRKEAVRSRPSSAVWLRGQSSGDDDWRVAKTLDYVRASEALGCAFWAQGTAWPRQDKGEGLSE